MVTFHIAIIDDSFVERELLRHVVEDIENVKVFAFSSGKEALEHLTNDDNHRIDAIICDWHMPEMSGYEFLQSVRMLHPTLPFIMVSAYTRKNLVMKIKRAGANDYIAKPFVSETVIDKVQQLKTQAQYLQ